MSFTRHLLVDGANIAHAWPELSAMMKRDRAEARTLLVRRLAAIHDEEQVRVTIVFDGRGGELALDRPSGHVTYSVLTTASGVTADEVIEQLVANSADAAQCVVATSDQAERQTVAAAGADLLTPDDLKRWLERVEQRQASRVSDLRSRNEREWNRP